MHQLPSSSLKIKKKLPQELHRVLGPPGPIFTESVFCSVHLQCVQRQLAEISGLFTGVGLGTSEYIGPRLRGSGFRSARLAALPLNQASNTLFVYPFHLPELQAPAR